MSTSWPQMVDIALADGTRVLSDWPLKPNETAGNVLVRVLQTLRVDYDDEATATVEWGLFERSMKRTGDVRRFHGAASWSL